MKFFLVGIGGLVGLAAMVLGLYLLPSGIAFTRGHPYRHLILVVNVCLGFTVLGWIVCLLWALAVPPQPIITQPARPAGRIIEGIATPIEEPGKT